MAVNVIALVCVTLVLILSSFEFVLPDAKDKLGLVPVNTFVTNYYSWNLFTSCFYESDIWKIVVELLLFIKITANIQIDDKETFILYSVVCVVACTLGASAYCFIRFFSTRLEEMILESIYGFSGVFITFAMFARQKLRSQSVLFALPFITYHNLPLAVLIFQIILWFAGHKQFSNDLVFTFISICVSWSYLRFYYRFEGPLGSPLGDQTEDFSFVNMFPMALHPIAIPFTTAFYNIFVMVGIFPPLEIVKPEKRPTHHLRYVDPSIASSHSDLKEDAIMERRRARAIKLLDAKMAELEKEETEGWESNAGSYSRSHTQTHEYNVATLVSTGGEQLEIVTESSSSGSGNGNGGNREPFTIVIKH